MFEPKSLKNYRDIKELLALDVLVKLAYDVVGAVTTVVDRYNLVPGLPVPVTVREGVQPLTKTFDGQSLNGELVISANLEAGVEVTVGYVYVNSAGGMVIQFGLNGRAYTSYDEFLEAINDQAFAKAQFPLGYRFLSAPVG